MNSENKNRLTFCSLKATLWSMETILKIMQEYIARDGKNHFREWFDSLKDIKAQVKIDIRISRLRLGNFGDAKGGWFWRVRAEDSFWTRLPCLLWSGRK